MSVPINPSDLVVEQKIKSDSQDLSLPNPNRAAYTPDELAERWGCTANTIRAMIKKGDLPAFRLGGRAFRIPIRAVEELEKCQNEITNSSCTEENGASTSKTKESLAAFRLARMNVI